MAGGSRSPHLLLAMPAMSLVATFPNSLQGSVAGFFIFLAIVYVIVRGNPTYFVAIAPVLFFWSSEIFSGLLIENGAFMDETAHTGSSTGAFARLGFFYSLYFALGSLAFLRPLEGPTEPAGGERGRPISFERPVLFGIMAIAAGATLFGAIRGFPLLQGIDRFLYRAEADFGPLTSFLSNRYIMYGALGLFFASGTRRRLALGVAVWLFLVSALYGEKFTSMVLGGTFFLMGTAVDRISRGKSLHLGAILGFAVATAAITLPLILLNYGATDNLGNAAIKLQNRIAVQGQLWFSTDESFGRLWQFDRNSIGSALSSLIDPREQAPLAAGLDHGMYYVMAPFLKARVLGWIVDGGGGFVFAHMPYWLMVSGYTGAAIVGLASFALYVFVARRVLMAIKARDLVSLAIWLKLMTWILAGYTTGYFWFLFGLKTVVVTGSGILWDTWHQRRHSAPVSTQTPSGRGRPRMDGLMVVERSGDGSLRRG